MIEINEDFALSVDSYSFILYEKYEIDGDVAYRNPTYYRDLQGALRGFCKRTTKKKKPDTYEELLKLEKKIANKIDKIENIDVDSIKTEYESKRR